MWELGNVEIRKYGNQEIWKLGNMEIRKYENEKMRKLGNVGISWRISERLREGVQTSEENEKYQKWTERDFEGKRVLGGWGQLIESLQEAYTNLGRLVQKGYVNS